MPKDTTKRSTKAAPAPPPPAKRGKAGKDPNAPKKALSSYMLFTQDHREIIKSENPGMTFGETGKALGDKWKGMSAAEKKPYEDKAQQAKVAYEKAKAAYEAKSGR